MRCVSCGIPSWLTLFIVQIVVLGGYCATHYTLGGDVHHWVTYAWMLGDIAIVPIVSSIVVTYRLTTLARQLDRSPADAYEASRVAQAVRSGPALCTEVAQVQAAAGRWATLRRQGPQSPTSVASPFGQDRPVASPRRSAVHSPDTRVRAASHISFCSAQDGGLDALLLPPGHQSYAQEPHSGHGGHGGYGSFEDDDPSMHESATQMSVQSFEDSEGDGTCGRFRSAVSSYQHNPMMMAAAAAARSPNVAPLTRTEAPALLPDPCRGKPPPYDPLLEHLTPWEAALRGVPDPGGPIFLQMLRTVKIGQSLLQITFPVFVLEPRSMIEKCSDQFVYGYLTRDIAGEPDPYLRMLLVCKWFLAGYHLRPQGAKKPYNSVLGECFACVFNEGRPVDERFLFLAEQVSHHPPVSAFYAEGKGVRYQATYHARSRLKGPNVAESTGHGGARLQIELPSGQTALFSLNWPTAVVHGFITGNMRVEVADMVTIKDHTTGVLAKLNFKRKGWVKGKYDQLEGVICTPDGEPTQHRISGLWHGRLQHHNGENSQVLVDSATMPAPRPRAIDCDGAALQSRAVWQTLTRALRDGDLSGAGAAKHAVEEKQRAVRRDMAARGETHRTKMFQFKGGSEALEQAAGGQFGKDALCDVDSWQFTADHFVARVWETMRSDESRELRGLPPVPVSEGTLHV